jgi:NADPH:quinone reductase-like Zn-dependent oxidoreductase
LQETGNKLVEGMKEGWVRPIIEREYDVSEAAAAHVDVMEHKKGARGKIVLRVKVN